MPREAGPPEPRRGPVGARLPHLAVAALTRAADENGTTPTDEVEPRSIDSRSAFRPPDRDTAAEICGTYGATAVAASEQPPMRE